MDWKTAITKTEPNQPVTCNRHPEERARQRPMRHICELDMEYDGPWERGLNQGRS